METRTPRTPTGDRSSGFDDAPALSMVKVPSDPAQVIVSHASFRVQLGASPRRAQSLRGAGSLDAGPDVAHRPTAGRRRPVVWSGRSAPDDTGAHRLLQAVRTSSVAHGEQGAGDPGATQVLPRIGADGLPGTGGYDARYGDGMPTQAVGAPAAGGRRARRHGGSPLLPGMRSAGSAYGDTARGTPGYGGPAYGDQDRPGSAYDKPEFTGRGRRRAQPSRRHGAPPASAAGASQVRHAYYPGRRLNLAVVLLPLRVLLGSVSVCAGMGKLCDPVYFDGGRQGSLVAWLDTLHPWEVAEPLRQFALQHPVGSGLLIAFTQVIVGMLTVLGLWQRAAAGAGALLSVALIVAVSWRAVPVYHASDLLYLAAWFPLIVAGAPVYSVDGRLSGSAWRRLGPRADIWELRQYVLRRGALVAALVTGVTLLVGSLLGGAVRDANRVVVPGPGEAPRNELPGSPLPGTPEKRHRASPSASGAPESAPGTTSAPSSAITTPGATGRAGAAGGATTGAGGGATGSASGGRPSQTQGTTGQAPPRHSAPAQQAPRTSSGPSSSGGTGTGSPSGGANSGGGGGSSSGGSDRLVGGLLG
ncbi:DoxX family membrane protein [Streptomyces nodosus]|uniref:DoxX family membrane protein n=1 Tax=Streptomyces nodosus TaxID=40318 RepID=UPI003452B935